MHILAKFCFSLFFLMIFQSCKNITNNEEPRLVTVFGTVTLTTETESLPLSSAIVIISDKSDSTDQNGNYRIQDIVEGDYTAKIIYSDLDTVKVSVAVIAEQDSIEIPFNISPDKKGEEGIFGSIVYEGIPVENVEIRVYDILDGTKIIAINGKTNSEGVFEINGLNKRLKEIHFSHEYLEENILEGYIKDMGYVANAECFDENLNGACVADLKTIEMNKNEIVWDYFPIEVGATWNFDYKLNSHRANSSDSYSGEVEWSVIDVNSNGEKSTYTIQEIFNGTYSITGPDCSGHNSFDTKTVEFMNDTLAFPIEIDELGKIDIGYPFRELGCSDLGYYYRKYSEMDLNRYYSPLIGDSVDFEKYGEALIIEASLSRNKGITKLFIAETPHNSGSYFSIAIKEN